MLLIEEKNLTYIQNRWVGMNYDTICVSISWLLNNNVIEASLSETIRTV